MRQVAIKMVLAALLMTSGSALVMAGQLMCPDTSDSSHTREVMATSSPEIKVRAGSQDDSHRWAEIVKPLTQKAIKLAKAQRTTQIEDGIEHGCNSMEQYVGQILPVPDKPSGCDHRIVTRPADSEHIWVEVVAICKYDWACCTPDAKGAHAASGNATGYALEGPISGNSASSVSSAPATSAPVPTKAKK